MCRGAQLTMWTPEYWAQYFFLFYNTSLRWGRSRLGSNAASSVCCPPCQRQSTTFKGLQAAECEPACVCVHVGVCCAKSCNVKSISSGRKPACRVLRLLWVSIFRKKKKKTGNGKLNPTPTGHEGAQPIREEDRKSEGGKWEFLMSRLFTGTQLNKNQVVHMIKVQRLPFVASLLSLCVQIEQSKHGILILNKKRKGCWLPGTDWTARIVTCSRHKWLCVSVSCLPLRFRLKQNNMESWKSIIWSADC